MNKISVQDYHGWTEEQYLDERRQKATDPRYTPALSRWAIGELDKKWVNHCKKHNITSNYP